MTSPAHDDANSLCYQMLVQFRELYQNRPAEAMLRYNFNKADAEQLQRMSQAELKSCASQGMLCFELKLPALTNHPLRARSALHVT